MINKVILVGNVGKDPVLNYSVEGNPNLKFSVATSESYKVGDEWKDKTEWHNIIIFGKFAEIFKTAKGNTVYIEGKTSTNTYEKDGVQMKSVSVIASTARNLVSKPTQGEPQDDDDMPL